MIIIFRDRVVCNSVMGLNRRPKHCSIIQAGSENRRSENRPGPYVTQTVVWHGAGPSYDVATDDSPCSSRHKQQRAIAAPIEELQHESAPPCDNIPQLSSIPFTVLVLLRCTCYFVFFHRDAPSFSPFCYHGSRFQGNEL